MASHARHFGHTLRDENGRAGTVDVEDIAMLSPTATNKSFHSLNQFTVANPASTIPTTPRRPAPNSAKKRRQVPDLSRPTPTLGHGVKMSMIFRDAANSLQGSGLSPNQKSSNMKKSRLPLSQARGTKFGSTCQDELPGVSGVRPCYSMPTHLTNAGDSTLRTTADQCLGGATVAGGMRLDENLWVSGVCSHSRIEEEGKEPISSGFATPIPRTPEFVENPEEVKYPVLENWRSLRSRSDASIFGSDDDDLHSTHGVPFFLPFPCSDAEAPRSDINTWLNGLVEVTSPGLSSSPKQSYDGEDLIITDAHIPQSITFNRSSPTNDGISPSKLKQDMLPWSRASSDKENISPSKDSSSPTRSPATNLQARIPSRFRYANTQAMLQATKPLHFAHPLTVSGHLSFPPKQKRARIDGNASGKTEAAMPTACRDFTIHEDQLAGALAQLSPDVERHRKGKGPRRERCMSYWDEDILQPGLQCMPMDVDGNGETVEKGKTVLGESEQAVESTTEKPFTKEDVGSGSFQFKA